MTTPGHTPPSLNKHIQDAVVGEHIPGSLFRWDVSMMDVGVTDDDSCAWTWRIDPPHLKELLQFLSDLSTRTWEEIYNDRTGGRERHKKHHDHPIAEISAEARKRFYGNVSDESHDKLFRLRYGGTKRLWGVRDRSIFHVVWVDLDHRVYPTDPN